MKEEYIRYRGSRQISIKFLYDYGRSKGMSMSFDDFSRIINFIPFDADALYAKLDKDFGLTLLYDKDGEFIKVVE